MSKTFEESLSELELLVNKLEQGDIPLEEALSSFQEGMKLSKNLSETLQKAQDTFTKMINEQGEEIFFEDENSNEK
jgi:exodeoxyribonuclease VII small subunit